jgi:multiple sugar transport system ATP-binding protein
MATLELRNVSKHFGRVAALRDLSLTVAEGEFVVLLGPTGAGKTTALRCIAGLEKLSGGEVYLDGEAQGRTPPALRDLVLVFQNYALYPRKTVYQNMAFPLEARGISADEAARIIREVAAKLKIDAYLDRRPAQLSGGQQQRVALGRAMVRRPRLYLMDEPLTNLDFKLRVEMRSELKRLQRELHGTFFYVTNDQVEAMSMADRVAVLHQGVLQQIDTPERVYQNPANRFVAGFVGSPRMNFLDCAVDGEAGMLAGDGWHLALSAGQRAAAKALRGGGATLGVRAEDLGLTHTPGDGALPVEVYVVEPLGDRLLVDVRLGGATLRVKTAPTFPARGGDRLWLRFDPAGLHLFDQSTGATLL